MMEKYVRQVNLMADTKSTRDRSAAVSQNRRKFRIATFYAHSILILYHLTKDIINGTRSIFSFHLSV